MQLEDAVASQAAGSTAAGQRGTRRGLAAQTAQTQLLTTFHLRISDPGRPTSGLPSPQPRERPTSMRSTRPWQALVMPPSWMVWPTTWGWMDGLGGGTAGKWAGAGGAWQ